MSVEKKKSEFKAMMRIIIESGKTEQAKQFAVDLEQKVLAKSDEFFLNPARPFIAIQNEIAPIEDNRIYHIGEIQMALLGKPVPVQKSRFSSKKKSA